MYISFQLFTAIIQLLESKCFQCFFLAGKSIRQGPGGGGGKGAFRGPSSQLVKERWLVEEKSKREFELIFRNFWIA